MKHLQSYDQLRGITSANSVRVNPDLEDYEREENHPLVSNYFCKAQIVSFFLAAKYTALHCQTEEVLLLRFRSNRLKSESEVFLGLAGQFCPLGRFARLNLFRAPRPVRTPAKYCVADS